MSMRNTVLKQDGQWICPNCKKKNVAIKNKRIVDCSCRTQSFVVSPMSDAGLRSLK